MEQALDAFDGLREGLEFGDEAVEFGGDEVSGLRRREGDGGAGERGASVFGMNGLHGVGIGG